jgi:hypothetical protein
MFISPDKLIEPPDKLPTLILVTEMLPELILAVANKVAVVIPVDKFKEPIDEFVDTKLVIVLLEEFNKPVDKFKVPIETLVETILVIVELVITAFELVKLVSSKLLMVDIDILALFKESVEAETLVPTKFVIEIPPCVTPV